ncbi:uncharacterized protein BX663DRAFT_500833 [Cokeromyces recurvatus]|uniref:uncharacterized protein n=1 Tax=Cokeromyces recurvatus TaxID=90255 RepID=UPI00221F5F8D|nr:uncharacterized protein BX663DRAFT_500833 [Cokeromyces recurvatus]KAI7905765.1 hypothetical protein BX663DRAFT_500833 [Cokeromyces recurvatus]
MALTMKSTSSCLITRKRKRSEKTVRFDVEHIVIIDTYSASDYDRGSPFSLPPIQYKINPAIPKLSLEIPSSPSAFDSEASSPDIETPIATTTTEFIINKKNNKKRPKLTINTTSLSTEGPLFFTKLSTNHYRHSTIEEEDYSNDYLVPMTAPAVATTFSY